MTLRALWLPCLLLAACGDDVQWAFVSNTTGAHGQQGLIVVIRSGSGSSGSLGLETAVLSVTGRDDRGDVTVHLPYASDVAVVERADTVELRSPALPAHAVDLPGASVEAASGSACLRVLVPEAQRLHDLAAGPGRLHVAANGTLLVLECGTGLVLFGERPEPEVLPPTMLLTTTPSGLAFAVLLPDGRLRVLVPGAAAPPEQRLVHDHRRDSVRLLGPWGEALAELPASAVELQPSPGLFLRAALAGGINGASRPTTLLMARDNRFLLRVDEP